MNIKIERVHKDIEKTKEKISELQTRLRDLEKQRTELENADIIAMVRNIDVPPDEFGEFVRLFKEQRKNKAVPDMDYQNDKEDVTIEN